MISQLLKKLGLLCLIVFVCFLFLITAFYYRVKRLKIDNNITTLICGDSHPQSGLDDSILQNSLNVCQMSEPYMGTYHVIKVITANNPQINVILLGYSFHNLSKSEEDQFNLEDFSKFFFPRYLCILDPLTMLKTSTDHFQNFIRTVPFILRNLLFPVISPSLSSFPFVGQYYRSHNQNCNDSTINRAINRHFINQTIQNGISAVQQKYLKVIVDYCASRNIKLYLVNTPVNIEYGKRIPESFKREYYAFYEQIKDRAFMVDLHDFKLSQFCYGDGDHLNEKGAAIISSKMDSLFRIYQGNLTYFNKAEGFSQAN